MNLQTLQQQLHSAPRSIDFKAVIALIDALYEFTPTEFRNGDLVNAAGQNNGSCKLFAFARLQGFDQAQTLACFGDYYFKDVLDHPQGSDHGNIRNFMRTGWAGIHYAGVALQPR